MNLCSGESLPQVTVLASPAPNHDQFTASIGGGRDLFIDLPAGKFRGERQRRSQLGREDSDTTHHHHKSRRGHDLFTKPAQLRPDSPHTVSIYQRRHALPGKRRAGVRCHKMSPAYPMAKITPTPTADRPKWRRRVVRDKTRVVSRQRPSAASVARITSP